MRNGQQTQAEQHAEHAICRDQTTASQRQAEQLRKQTQQLVDETLQMRQAIDAMTDELQQHRDISADLEQVMQRARQELLVQQRERDVYRAAAIKSARQVKLLQQRIDDCQRSRTRRVESFDASLASVL
eukprot:TRINITY_DN4162_c0_g1_i2.p1 TRINITY_DN4162_c0_g1~~TRINITY_DN4162_c0_g1_i2.p1  ORF type:complete len:129 (-),score=24.10 TRINITY_DN4162_c0_g1_i2:168-554(-)